MALVCAPPAAAAPVPVVTPTVIAAVPHDPRAYSEGLELDGPALYESTGEAGNSQLREVDPTTGRVLRSADLPPTYFGEGITVVGEHIWQLTYQNGVVIEWDEATLTPLREIPVPTSVGWGICLDGDRLVTSDGTDRLVFHDVNSFAETGSMAVTSDGKPVSGLDELECVDGQVWAAAWPGDQFVRIDSTGAVDLVLDVSGLWTFGPRSNRQVVSAIAHVSGSEYMISGKEWPESLLVRIDSPP
jgi:glutamine cyclotransferase